MASQLDAPGPDLHADASQDPILDALRQLNAFLAAVDGRKKNTNKDDAQKAMNHTLQIESHYLLLLQRVKQLELIEKVHEKCHEMNPQKQQTGNSNNNNNTKSYASAVGCVSTKPVIDPYCTMRVFPKNPEELLSSEATKAYLNTLSLKGENIGIKHLKSIKGNGVSVLCRSEKEVEALYNKFQTDRHCKAEFVKMKLPVMSILLRGKDWNKKELEDDINGRNDFPKDQSVTVVKLYHTAQDNTIAILEPEPGAYKVIVENGSKLYVEWTRVSVREQDPISQCWKCQRYGHKAPKCRHSVDGKPANRCAQCSLHHEPNDVCTGAPCCANCKDFNVLATKRRWRTVEANHSAKDPMCPTRIKAFERARAYIIYD